jgi:transcriptional regulator with XRE-family HTH domain
MQSSVKDRLIIFLEYKNISQNKFEKSVGLGNGYVNNIRTSIQPDKLQRIAQLYPELNFKWLLTGIGDMLCSNEVEKDDVNCGDMSVFISKIQELTIELYKANQEIFRLRKEKKYTPTTHIDIAAESELKK